MFYTFEMYSLKLNDKFYKIPLELLIIISFKAFHLTLIKKDRQNGEHKKRQVFIEGAEL